MKVVIRLELIPFVGFVMLGVQVHRATRAIAQANCAGRMAPDLVDAAWKLHDRWSVALLTTLVTLGAFGVVVGVAGLLR